MSLYDISGATDAAYTNADHTEFSVKLNGVVIEAKALPGLMLFAALVEQGTTIAAYIAPEPPVPTITKAQALLYLLSIGKTNADVDAAISTIADPTERAVAEIEWNYRQPCHHDHPLFIALGPAVGIPDIEAAFRAAATL